MFQSRVVLFHEVSPFQDGRQYAAGDWQRVPEVVHDDHTIKGFFGEYRWLSNFGAAAITLDGVEYDGVERAYQAAKWSPEQRVHFTDCSNIDAITYNRDNVPNLYTPAEWSVAKLVVMRFLLEQKFDPTTNPDNAAKLIETGDRYLEETNWWGDTYWGKTLAGEGCNHLGNLIMAIRSS